MNAVNLHLGYLDDATLTKLFFVCDAIIFPYRIVSVSGVMFDALAHGLPFVASNLEFFKEFEEMGFGITCNRDPTSFSEAIKRLTKDYGEYRKNVNQFSKRLRWDNIAEEHINFFSTL
jgi:glycosyltransferase involved in cell wall biosynthesis